MHSQQTRITNTTLLDGNITCDGVVVIFTCVTEGPNNQGLIWSSEYYVGRDGKQIQFIAHEVSQTKGTNGNRDTNATLTEASDITNNQIRLTSKLRILASVSTSDAFSGSVTCRRTGEGQAEGDTQHFQVLGKQLCKILCP